MLGFSKPPSGEPWRNQDLVAYVAEEMIWVMIWALIGLTVLMLWGLT